MLLLQPSTEMLSFLTPRCVGNVTRVVAGTTPAGARVAVAMLDHLLSCPFVEYVRMVAGR